MKFRGFLLVMVLAGATAATAESPVFRYKAPAKGASVETENDTKMEMRLEVLSEGKPVGVSQLETRTNEVSRQEVLEANEDGPTRIRVHYVKSEKTKTRDEEIERTVHPQQGKTYIVAATAEGIQVTDEKGSKPGPEEVEELEGEFGKLGERDKFCDALAGKKLHPGQKIDDSAVAGALLGASLDDMLKIEEITFHFREFKSHGAGKAGVFDIKMKLSATVEETLGMTVEFTGQVEVSTEGCRLLLAELEGPVRFSGTMGIEGQSLEMRGQGTGRIVMRSKYK